MNSITERISAVLMPISQKIASNKLLRAVSKGFMYILPVTILSSMFYLIANFPITAWTNFISANGIQNYILIGYNVTMGLLSIYTSFAIAYAVAQEEGINPISTGIIALFSFLVVTPYTTGDMGSMSFEFTNLGCRGLFVAIIVSLVAAYLTSWIEKKGFVIKMPDGVPPYVADSFNALIPGFVNVVLFTIVAYVFAHTSYGSIHEFVYTNLQRPLQSLGGSLGGYLIATVLIQLLWWFGIHGFNVVAPIMMPIWLSIDAARLAGETTAPIGMAFMTAVGQSTVCVVIIMLFFCKSKQLKQIGKVAAPAAIFNIGEPVVFGVPNVLNPYMFIPSVLLVPIVTNLFMYIGFASGIVAPLSGAQVSMQVPVVLYGLVQGNWSLALWQLLEIPLGIALYLPFYKMYDKTLLEKEKELESIEAE